MQIHQKHLTHRPPQRRPPGGRHSAQRTPPRSQPVDRRGTFQAMVRRDKTRGTEHLSLAAEAYAPGFSLTRSANAAIALDEVAVHAMEGTARSAAPRQHGALVAAPQTLTVQIDARATLTLVPATRDVAMCLHGAHDLLAQARLLCEVRAVGWSPTLSFPARERTHVHRRTRAQPLRSHDALGEPDLHSDLRTARERDAEHPGG